MMRRIRSATNPFFRILRFILRDAIAICTMNSPDISLENKVEAVFQMASTSSKLCIRWVKQGWRTPVARQNQRKCERIQNEVLRALNNDTLTEEELDTYLVHIARVMLGSLFDHITIRKISAFAGRMGLYQLEEGKPAFKSDLEAQDIIRLMEERVPAVCISYKHTRRSRDGLPRDIARVQKAVSQAASQLSQKRLLFWCDVIGQTPQGASWAEQGIDPYLCMPTLRIVSAELREEIDDSFWMTIERIAAMNRGGVLSYDEDDARLKFGPPEDGYCFSVSNMSPPFEVAKMAMAKSICNPMLYYRRARYEDDKLEVMRYAIYSTDVGPKLYALQANEAGLLKLVSDHDFKKVFGAIAVDRSLVPSDIFHVSRPRAETIIGDGERWHGFEESFPALQLVEPRVREFLNKFAREMFSWICPVSPAVDNVTDVIFAPMENAALCSALRLRVAGFEEHDDHVIGRVVSFRVAAEEEELLLTNDGTIIGKKVCFH